MKRWIRRGIVCSLARAAIAAIIAVLAVTPLLWLIAGRPEGLPRSYEIEMTKP